MINQLFSSNSICTHNHDASIAINVMFMVFCAIIAWLLVFVVKCLLRHDRVQCRVPNSVPLPISEAVSNERTVNPNISYLPHFKSIKPFIFYSIRSTTAKRMMTDVMDTAMKTTRFSILPELSALIPNSMSIQIALVQPS
jgi:hypothetical protein